MLETGGAHMRELCLLYWQARDAQERANRGHLCAGWLETMILSQVLVVKSGNIVAGTATSSSRAMC